MGQLPLFEYHRPESDCFLSGTPDQPDNAVETFLCWKQIAGLALAREFIVCDTPEDGYRFRAIASTVSSGSL
jgi:hypothetical protein